MNPDGQMRLKDSVKLYGLCTDMCPEFERVRRIVEDDVKPPECVRGAVFYISVTNAGPDTRDAAPAAQAAHRRRGPYGQGLRALRSRHGRRVGFGDPYANRLSGT
jgi:hypothetical protein